MEPFSYLYLLTVSFNISFKILNTIENWAGWVCFHWNPIITPLPIAFLPSSIMRGLAVGLLGLELPDDPLRLGIDTPGPIELFGLWPTGLQALCPIVPMGLGVCWPIGLQVLAAWDGFLWGGDLPTRYMRVCSHSKSIYRSICLSIYLSIYQCTSTLYKPSPNP